MSVAATTTETNGVHHEDLTEWKRTINTLGAQCMSYLPAVYHDRLSRGIALALDPAKVQQGKDGLWHVAADKSGFYAVNGSCVCKDVEKGQAPNGYCKHRMAANLVKMAKELPPDSLFLNPEEVFGDAPPLDEADDEPPTWGQMTAS